MRMLTLTLPAVVPTQEQEELEEGGQEPEQLKALPHSMHGGHRTRLHARVPMLLMVRLQWVLPSHNATWVALAASVVLAVLAVLAMVLVRTNTRMGQQCTTSRAAALRRTQLRQLVAAMVPGSWLTVRRCTAHGVVLVVLVVLVLIEAVTSRASWLTVRQCTVHGVQTTRPRGSCGMVEPKALLTLLVPILVAKGERGLVAKGERGGGLLRGVAVDSVGQYNVNSTRYS
jgi:hypothetical protein